MNNDASGERREDVASGAILLVAILVIAATIVLGVVRDDWETILVALGAAAVLLDFVRGWFRARR